LNNYDFIYDLFQTNLNASAVIQGRFHVGYRYGLQDGNYDVLGEVLTKLTTPVKYPLAIMAPPHSMYKVLGGHNAQWEEYRIIMFFVKQTFYDDIGVVEMNPRTGTSQKTVMSIWDDMKTEAYDFLNRLIADERAQAMPAQFAVPAHQALFVPVSHVGADRVSGMRLDFDIKIFNGC